MIQLNTTKEQSLINPDTRKGIVLDVVKNIPSLSNLTSRVALVLDFSGSMRNLYKNGTVQSVIERIMPIAMQFDDNGELDLWIFESKYTYIGSVNRNNFYGLATEIMNRYRMGGTNYAPVMKDIYNKYIKQEPAQIANYIIFITDGDNSDKKETTEIMKEYSKYPIFWQFVGIGRECFNYLEKLDDMGGRYVDNADFFAIKDINEMPDETLYQKLLDEYPGWLENSKVREMIVNGGASGGGLFGMFRR